MTDNPETAASTDYFLGACGLRDNLKGRVQRRDVEPANVPAEWLQVTSKTQSKSLNSPLQQDC